MGREPSDFVFKIKNGTNKKSTIQSLVASHQAFKEPAKRFSRKSHAGPLDGAMYF